METPEVVQLSVLQNKFKKKRDGGTHADRFDYKYIWAPPQRKESSHMLEHFSYMHILSYSCAVPRPTY